MRRGVEHAAVLRRVLEAQVVESAHHPLVDDGVRPAQGRLLPAGLVFTEGELSAIGQAILDPLGTAEGFQQALWGAV
jgi:hypothetical protein